MISSGYLIEASLLVVARSARSRPVGQRLGNRIGPQSGPCRIPGSGLVGGSARSGASRLTSGTGRNRAPAAVGSGGRGGGRRTRRAPGDWGGGAAAPPGRERSRSA